MMENQCLQKAYNEKTLQYLQSCFSLCLIMMHKVDRIQQQRKLKHSESL